MHGFVRSCVLLVGCTLVGTNAGAQLSSDAGQSSLRNAVGSAAGAVTSVLPKTSTLRGPGVAVPGLKSPTINSALDSGRQLTTQVRTKIDTIGSAANLTDPLAATQLSVPDGLLLRVGTADETRSATLRSTGVATVQPLAGVAVLDPLKHLEERQLRHRRLLDSHSNELESDGIGQPVRRGVLVVLNPDSQTLQRATKAGYRLIGVETHRQIGVNVTHLALPPRTTAVDALNQLRRLIPGVQADFDHIFEPSGGKLLALAGSRVASGGKAARWERIGMIDGGVAPHPALAGSAIHQRGFSGPPRATGHGTAVASLAVGHAGPFHGGACGATLFVGDVYGGNPANGSASALVRAMAWLASQEPHVINISLVGPSNRIVRRAIEVVRARGIPIVAPVGNDGPAAPPQYPASYEGVVAVTGVDARGKALLDAGRATHLDFAAPAADMAAAVPGQRYARVRGTSFAAPLVASRLARAGSLRRLAAEARPGQGRVGRGIICFSCRVDPREVRATATLSN